MFNSISIIEGLFIIAGIITIASAFIWIVGNRYKICNWFAQPRRYSNLLGIRRIHRDRKQALQNLLPKLQASKIVRVMNLKGYSIVEESNLPETLLYKILAAGQPQKNVDILIHYPDSNALKDRVKELGKGYSFMRIKREHQYCIHEIEDISKMFQGQVNVRYFSEPNALWSILLWDDGLLLGWYEEKPSHRSMCIELNRTSNFGRQFEKYYTNVWESRSVSKDFYEGTKPVYPVSRTYPKTITGIEKFINSYYNRSPARENAFIILIGGGAGTGKSTLAWHLSHLLGVRSVISTDSIMQLLRVGNLKNDEEILLAETWEAWQYLDEQNGKEALFQGFIQQASIVSSVLKSFIEYHLSKGMPTIIEGIHILPNEYIKEICKYPQVLIFYINATREQITDNFEMRRHSTHMRGIEEQFAAFDARVMLKTKIIEMANKNNFPVILADNWDDLQRQALETIMDHYTKHLMTGSQ